MKPFTVYLSVRRSHTLDRVIEAALQIAAVEKVHAVEFIFGHRRMVSQEASNGKISVSTIQKGKRIKRYPRCEY